MRYRGSYFPDSATQYIDDFGGLDLRNRIANNSFSEMLNMSPEGAPELVTRAYRYLSRAQFGEGEYVGAITTVTVCRDDLSGTTPSNGKFSEEPVYVLTTYNSDIAVTGNKLVFGADGNTTTRGFKVINLNSNAVEHSLAVIDRRLIIAPEMIVVNLDTGEADTVEATTTATEFGFTDVDLTDFGAEIDGYTAVYPHDGEPDAEEIEWLQEHGVSSFIAMMANGETRTRYDANGNTLSYKGYEIRRCSSSNNWTTHAWVTQNKFLKLFTSDAAKFRKDDAISVSGTGTALDGEYVIFAVGNDHIVINAEFSGAPFDYCPDIDSQTGTWRQEQGHAVNWNGKATFGYTSQRQAITATIKRKLPPFQCICESGNRIWWAGFGQTENGLVNEIGCSAQGDPYDFYNMSKAWISEVGTAGDFTGACDVGGTPVFFKDNCVFEVSGSLPSSFKVTKRDTRGIEEKSAGALCVNDGAVYYQSSDGPRVYGGSYSQRLTAALGNTDIDASALAADGRFIYIAASKVTANADGSPLFAGDGDLPGPPNPSPLADLIFYIKGLISHIVGVSPSLFVYDTEKGALYRLEDHYFTCLAPFSDGGVIGFDATAGRLVSTKRISRMIKESEPVQWQATTGDVYVNMPDMKYISAARIRMRVAAGGYAELWLSCDRGQWERQAFFDREGVFTYRVPIIPGRCDSFRLRMSGEGQARIVSIAYEITDGGQNSGQTF
jgi:hypothetical protein